MKIPGILSIISVGIAIAAAGCSRHAAPTYTPQFKVGPPTNTSVVNSWQLNSQPLYTQPGVNAGKPYVPKSVESQRGFEPYDPLATAVYAALNRDHGLNTRYLAVSAKKGVVKISGVLAKTDEKRAMADARSVHGVHNVIIDIRTAVQ